ncbi:MAG: aminoglycoside phosphotransferase family protein [Sphingomonadales bacterium]
MTGRRERIADFLKRHGWGGAGVAPLAGDASFRRYFRLQGPARAVLMDAPPEHEDVRPFIAVANHLAALGYSSPGILAADIDEGFLLLEDLGDDRFTALLSSGREPGEKALYEAAVDVLVDLHRHQPPSRLPIRDHLHFDMPAYDESALLGEARLFIDWYLPALTGQGTAPALRTAFENMWRALFADAELGRSVLVLRDYHADNLMWLPGRTGLDRVGLLDFQDAVIGCPAYDLVSLLQDARRDVPPALESAMIARYQAAAKAADPAFDATWFIGAYHLLGAQRNTKIIGIFTRLWRRDGKSAYLDLIGRVWGLLERDLEHPALTPARKWFDRHVPRAIRGNKLKEGMIR